MRHFLSLINKMYVMACTSCARGKKNWPVNSSQARSKIWQVEFQKIHLNACIRANLPHRINSWHRRIQWIRKTSHLGCIWDLLLQDHPIFCIIFCGFFRLYSRRHFLLYGTKWSNRRFYYGLIYIAVYESDLVLLALVRLVTWGLNSCVTQLVRCLFLATATEPPTQPRMCV